MQAAIAINDLLDNCARIWAGQEALVLAYIDGLHGGDNMVDEEAVSRIQTAVELRNADATILWMNTPAVLAMAAKYPGRPGL